MFSTTHGPGRLPTWVRSLSTTEVGPPLGAGSVEPAPTASTSGTNTGAEEPLMPAGSTCWVLFYALVGFYYSCWEALLGVLKGAI